MGALDGKVALITGAASGIGRATAERLTAEGARVGVVDLTDDAGRAVAEAVGGPVAGSVGGVFHRPAVGEPHEVDAAFASVERDLGGVDVAFLNAGIAIGHPQIETLPDDLYRLIMRVNVDGVVYGARAAVRAMERRGGGAIVATSSLAGLIPLPPDPVYDLTKHAVVGFIRSIAPALVAKGITANTVNPGMTDTKIMGEEARRTLREANFPIMPPGQTAAAVPRMVPGGGGGECGVSQPGRKPEPYRFHDVPGPRTE